MVEMRDRRNASFQLGVIDQVTQYFEEHIRDLLRGEHVVLLLPKANPGHRDWSQITDLWHQAWETPQIVEKLFGLTIDPEKSRFSLYRSSFDWFCIKEARRQATYVGPVRTWRSHTEVGGKAQGYVLTYLDKDDAKGKRTLVIPHIFAPGSINALATGLLGTVDYAVKEGLDRVLLPLHPYTTGENQPSLRGEMIFGIFPQAEQLGIGKEWLIPGDHQSLVGDWLILFDRSREDVDLQRMKRLYEQRALYRNRSPFG